MFKLLKLNIDLVRAKFKIYGFFNIFSLILTISIVLTGVKLLQYKMNIYNEISLIILAFITMFLTSHIYPNNYKEKAYKVKLYFNSIKYKTIERYFLYKNLIIFYLVCIYLLFPTRLFEFRYYLLYMFIISFIVFLQISIKIKGSNSHYTILSNIMNVLVYITLILQLRKIINIPFYNVTKQYMMPVYILLIFYLFFKNIKLIYRSCIHIDKLFFVNLTKKIPYIRKNKDLLLIIREGFFMDPIVAILSGSLVFKSITNTKLDMILLYAVSSLVAYIYLYIEILIYENSKFVCMYNKVSVKRIKKEKMFSVMFFSIIITIITSIPLLIFMPISVIFIGYILSIVIFMIITLLIPLSIEKNMDMVTLIKPKEIKIITYITLLMSFAITIIFSGI